VLEQRLAGFLHRFRTGQVTPGYMLQEKRDLARLLRTYQRYPTVICIARRAWYGTRHSKFAKRLRPTPRKRLVGPGLYAALAGADGSGKTSLGRDLPTWLSWKLGSSTVYLGQPKHSPPVLGFRRARKLAREAAARLENAGSVRAARVLTRCEAAANAALWLYIAGYRVRLNAKATRRATRGEVIFAERFPLRDFWSMAVPMDGPRLGSAASGPRPQDGAARLERRLYERLRRPDYVLVLRASLDTLQTRKPETPLEEHRAKVRAVNDLAERGHYDVIDAEQPYEEVLLAAKRRVWWNLVGRTQDDLQTSDGLTA
jgi:hypothetical protein